MVQLLEAALGEFPLSENRGPRRRPLPDCPLTPDKDAHAPEAIGNNEEHESDPPGAVRGQRPPRQRRPMTLVWLVSLGDTGALQERQRHQAKEEEQEESFSTSMEEHSCVFYGAARPLWRVHLT